MLLGVMIVINYTVYEEGASTQLKVESPSSWILFPIILQASDFLSLHLGNWYMPNPYISF